MERSRQPDRHTVTPSQIPSGAVSSGGTQTITTTAPSGVFSLLNQEVLRSRPALEQGSRLQERYAVTRSQLRYDLGNVTVTGRERQSDKSEHQGLVQQHYAEYQLFPVSRTSQGDTVSTSVLSGESLISGLWACGKAGTSSAASNIPLLSGTKRSGVVEREGARVHVVYSSCASAITGEKVTQCGSVDWSDQALSSHIQPVQPIYTVAQGSDGNLRLSSATSLQLLRPSDQPHSASEERMICGAIAVEDLERKFFRESTLLDKTMSSGFSFAQPATTVITTIGESLGEPVTSLIQASRSSYPTLTHHASLQRPPLLPLPRSLPSWPRSDFSIGVVRQRLLPVSSAPVPAITAAFPASIFPGDPARQAVFDHISSMQEKRIRANVLRWTSQGGIACSIKSKRERESHSGFSIKFLFLFPHVNSRWYLPVYNDLDELRRRFKFIWVTTYFKPNDVEAYVRRIDPKNFEDASYQSDPSIPIYGKRIELIN